VVYQEVGGERQAIDGAFVLKDEQEVGFALGAYDGAHPLVIDPVLVYSTYLGGSGEDLAAELAVDQARQRLCDWLYAVDKLPTQNPLQPVHGGSTHDAFVAKINAQGSALVYSTYLGGNGVDLGYGLVVDSNADVYLTGVTNSTNFPMRNSFQATLAGVNDTFVTKLNAQGSALLYSTYLGGNGEDEVRGIALTSSRNAVVAGARRRRTSRSTTRSN